VLFSLMHNANLRHQSSNYSVVVGAIFSAMVWHDKLLKSGPMPLKQTFCVLYSRIVYTVYTQDDDGSNTTSFDSKFFYNSD
jgi:hypothetical protein